MQLKTKLKSMITSWSSNFARNLHKNIFPLILISQWFLSFCVPVFCQIIVTLISTVVLSTKCYYYYFLSTAKTSLTDNKKWWKFFCGDQLERIFISSCSDSFPSRTGFGSRLWITLRAKKGDPESTCQVDWLFLDQLWLTVLLKLQLYSNFHAILKEIWTWTLFFSEQVSKSKLPSSVQILVCWAIDCGDQKPRKTDGQKALFHWRKSAEMMSRASVFFSFLWSSIVFLSAAKTASSVWG